MCSLLLSLETPNDVQSVDYVPLNIATTRKGSAQTARISHIAALCASIHLYTENVFLCQNTLKKLCVEILICTENYMYFVKKNTLKKSIYRL